MNSGFSLNPDKKMQAEKKRLRQEYKAKRLGIPAPRRMQTAEAIARQIVELPQWTSARYVAGYWATRGEVPLHVVQMRVQSPKVWCLPVVQADKSLKFAPWRSGDTLVSNQYGIPEPDLEPSSLLAAQDLGIVLVPLLAYTRAGTRLGMGAGYYDRSFAFRRDNLREPLLIGIAYSDQEAEMLPDETWDVKLDIIINEHEVLHFDKV